MTAAEIRDLLAQLLAGAAGETKDSWRLLIGQIELVPIALNPSCNWKVNPAGSITQVEAIMKAAAVVRSEHPYVDAAR